MQQMFNKELVDRWIREGVISEITDDNYPWMKEISPFDIGMSDIWIGDEVYVLDCGKPIMPKHAKLRVFRSDFIMNSFYGLDREDYKALIAEDVNRQVRSNLLPVEQFFPYKGAHEVEYVAGVKSVMEIRPSFFLSGFVENRIIYSAKYFQAIINANC